MPPGSLPTSEVILSIKFSACSSFPRVPTVSTCAPKAAMLTVLFPAPPGVNVLYCSKKTGTVDSGDTLVTSPKKDLSSIKSPTTITLTLAKLFVVKTILSIAVQIKILFKMIIVIEFSLA